MGWLVAHTYSRFDVMWIVLFVLALQDRNYIAAALFVLVGTLSSALLERVVARTTKERTRPS